MNAKSTFVLFDKPTAIEGFLNAIRGDIAGGMGSIQRSDLLALFIQAIRYGLSCESGIPIEVQLKGDVLSIFAKRLIQRVPYNFDEISEKSASGLIQISEDGDRYALEHLTELSVSELSSLQQTTVANISRKLGEMIRLVERQKEYEIFKPRELQLAEGTVVRFEVGSPVIDLGGYEGLLPRGELIPGEFVNIGDKLFVYIREVRMASEHPNQYQIVLNRSSPEFVVKLIEANVPEVASGSITVKGCARRAGRLSKVAVASADTFTEPVWPCVGKGGARLKHIRSLMSQEGLHIIRWSDSQAEYICNALYPLEPAKIIFESDREAEVVLPEEYFNSAMARDRIQVRLAASLTNTKIKIISENAEIARTAEQKSADAKMLQELGLNDAEIGILDSYGLGSIEGIMECSDNDLISILPSTNITDLRTSITELLKQKSAQEYMEHGIDLELLNMPVNIDASILAEYGIKTRDDLTKMGPQMITNMLRKQLYSSDIDQLGLTSMAEELEEWGHSGE